MKIFCDDFWLEKNLQDLVNLFYDEQDEPFSINQSIKISDNVVESVITLQKQEMVSFSTKFKLKSVDELRRKSELLSGAKNHLYDVLTLEAGKSLPWGSLTGVRPTKFAREKIERGETKPHLVSEMLVRDFHVSKDKASLVTQILKNQNCIIKNDKLVDLFINIPICPTRCNYCSFISSELSRVQPLLEIYLDCLIKEIQAVKKMVVEKSYIIRTIYIGGGTPTVLSASQLERLLGELTFSVNEFTVECGRADTITAEKLDVLKKYGVTRISINPQTFCETTLKRIGRKTTNKQVFDAYMLAMERGFEVNMDIIAGLTGERLGIFKRTIKTLLELYPENVTLHTLSIKNASEIRGQEIKFEQDVQKMVEFGEKSLIEAGYKPYYLYRQKHQLCGLENVGFFRDDKICIFNVDSMEDTASIIAVGAGAISKRVFSIENHIERQPNCKFIEDYISRIDELIEKKTKFFA